LRSFQERVLGTRRRPSHAPTKWWGAQESAWFNEQGLRKTPSTVSTWTWLRLLPEQFRIPPREIEEMLPQQIMMLSSAAAAMADAGLDRENNLRTGVFTGIALDLNSTNFSFRWSWPNKPQPGPGSWDANCQPRNWLPGPRNFGTTPVRP